MKHDDNGLAQMQSLPLEAKVRMTVARIRSWADYWEDDIYISFSGGKDSTVLKHIVDSIIPNVPAVFVNTGLEYPDVRQFALSQKNVVRVDPKLKFYDVITRYGYPVVSKEQAQYIYEARTTKSEKLRNIRLYGKDQGLGKISERWKFLLDAPFKISNKCCDFLKKQPVKQYEKETGRKPIVATMAAESRLRLLSWQRHGCNAFDAKRPISQPMAFWTEQDVLQYIVQNKLEIAKPYGEIVEDEDGLLHCTGLSRTGCMFCMFGAHQEEYSRFDFLKANYPKQYDYCMNQLGLKKVLAYIKKHDNTSI